MDENLLPPPLAPTVLRAVFAFVTSPDSHKQDAVNALQTLAQVCREWYDCARNMALTSPLRTLVVSDSAFGYVSTMSRGELFKLRREVTLRRGHLRELDISIGASAADMASTWCATLMHVPRLETLVLRSRSQHKRHCVPIVAAAARHCRRLQTLYVLSLRRRSLPAWTPCGGLRDLGVTVPFTYLREPHVKATQFLSAIAATCPKLTTISINEKMCSKYPCEQLAAYGEHWRIGLETWELFCASCTELTEFDWRVAPFATSFRSVWSLTKAQAPHAGAND